MLGFVFAGCGNNPIDLVKKGTLNDYPSVTIGDALEVSFSDGKWETFETDKKELVVEFTGKVSKKLSRKIELFILTAENQVSIDTLNKIGLNTLQDLLNGKKLDLKDVSVNETIIINSLKFSVWGMSDLQKENLLFLIGNNNAKIQFLINKNGENFEISFFGVENTTYNYEDLADLIFN